MPWPGSRRKSQASRRRFVWLLTRFAASTGEVLNTEQMAAFEKWLQRGGHFAAMSVLDIDWLETRLSVLSQLTKPCL